MYTDYATVIRCVRPDQSAITFRCHYLSDGMVNAAFVIRRQEYFIPAGVLLKCFLEVRRECLASSEAGPGSCLMHGDISQAGLYSVGM